MGKYRDYAPALKLGHKIYPEDLAGMIGLPSVGNIYYVDPGSGSDSSSGRTRSTAFLTVAKALSATTADQDDVVLITPSSSTGRTSEAAAINWNKRRTHLIGSTSPLMFSPRAGMSFGSGAGTPSFTMSARSCIVKNITIAQFNDVENNILVDITSSYTYWEGVHFAGIGNELTGNDAGARCVRLNGADESVFNSCTFGLDTVVRTAANYTLEFAGPGKNNSNNRFNDCTFTLIADADAPRHVYTDTGGSSLNRFAIFNHCFFIDNSDVASGTQLTDVMALDDGGDQGGVIILKDCMNVGSIGWTNQVNAIKILGASNNATTLTDYGTGVAPAA